jgi:hypothetical protein
MQEYFEFLVDLRDGRTDRGSMNMAGAPRELQYEFGLSKVEAREVFTKWCDSLKGEGNE